MTRMSPTTSSFARWRTLSESRPPEQLPQGIDAMTHRCIGMAQRLVPRRRSLLRRADRVLAMERQFTDMGSANLRESAAEIAERIVMDDRDVEQVDRAFALVREVARREVGLHPYRVQVAAGLAMHAGLIAELATGEGKTLSATMPAVLAGWRRRGCHIITVNDYLAQRDAEWMTPIYRFCGLTVRYLTQETPPPERRAAYEADITYLTNKEVTADFLRDQLAMGRRPNLASVLHQTVLGGAAINSSTVMRGLAVAIVDEADSVLVDEAVTPLIISGSAPNDEQVRAFEQATQLAAQLEPDRDYQVNQRYREVKLTDRGRDRLTELCADLHGIWAGQRRRNELVTQALSAGQLFHRDQHYIIDDGKIVLVDEFTGRLMPDRTWRAGLHQAVESKEQLDIQPMKDTLARISFQRFFRQYPKLCGMTGTAWEARHEFWQVYRRQVVRIPTHRPCIRKHTPDQVHADAPRKWAAVVERIRRLHGADRPVLIGTRSIKDSEHLSALLTEAGLQHQVLNAVRHAEEAQIVAQAGQPGAITVATNMAGRGTDIKLGRGVSEAGGLEVIAADRNDSSRVDRQLFGRCARQGDPGSVTAFISLDDELLRRYSTPPRRWLLRAMLGGGTRLHRTLIARIIAAAQNKAERQSLQQRKGVLRYDEWLDEQLGFAGRE